MTEGGEGEQGGQQGQGSVQVWTEGAGVMSELADAGARR